MGKRVVSASGEQSGWCFCSRARGRRLGPSSCLCWSPEFRGQRGSSARQAAQLVTTGVEWSNHAMLLLATDLAMVEAPGQTLSPL